MTGYRRSFRALPAIALLAALTALAVITSGCATKQFVAKDGEMTCIECHTDRDLLKADLKADPKPKKVVAESEGEG
jgi:hypothetical protein